MNMTEKAAALLTEVRSRSPLIHNITNYVTVNDCANVTLAIGASPSWQMTRKRLRILQQFPRLWY